MDEKIKDIIETLKKEITSLKNIIDSKEAQITAYQSTQTALYTDVKRLRSVSEEHQKLNGRLRLEINELNGSWKKYNETRNKLKKKEADKLMIEKIKKYEKKIRQLKNDAKDLLNYPWYFLATQYIGNIQRQYL